MELISISEEKERKLEKRLQSLRFVIDSLLKESFFSVVHPDPRGFLDPNEKEPSEEELWNMLKEVIKSKLEDLLSII